MPTFHSVHLFYTSSTWVVIAQSEKQKNKFMYLLYSIYNMYRHSYKSPLIQITYIINCALLLPMRMCVLRKLNCSFPLFVNHGLSLCQSPHNSNSNSKRQHPPICNLFYVFIFFTTLCFMSRAVRCWSRQTKGRFLIDTLNQFTPHMLTIYILHLLYCL